jgi:hypothetical protein
MLFKLLELPPPSNEAPGTSPSDHTIQTGARHGPITLPMIVMPSLSLGS